MMMTISNHKFIHDFNHNNEDLFDKLEYQLMGRTLINEYFFNFAYMLFFKLISTLFTFVFYMILQHYHLVSAIVFLFYIFQWNTLLKNICKLK